MIVLYENIFLQTASGPSLSKEEQDLLRGGLSAAADNLIQNEALLNKLDSGCGDGDCGITIKKFGLGRLLFCSSLVLLEQANQILSNPRTTFMFRLTVKLGDTPKRMTRLRTVNRKNRLARSMLRVI